MARQSILDSPDARECIYRFCQDCGRETFRNQNCWDKVISKARYFVYKETHPDFAEKVQESCHFYFLRAARENPKRYKKTWEIIDSKLKNGETETKIFSKFSYKENEDGTLVLDEKTRQPVPHRLIGQATQQITQKPCSDNLIKWLVDKIDNALNSS